MSLGSKGEWLVAYLSHCNGSALIRLHGVVIHYGGRCGGDAGNGRDALQECITLHLSVVALTTVLKKTYGE